MQLGILTHTFTHIEHSHHEFSVCECESKFSLAFAMWVMIKLLFMSSNTQEVHTKDISLVVLKLHTYIQAYIYIYVWMYVKYQCKDTTKHTYIYKIQLYNNTMLMMIIMFVLFWDFLLLLPCKSSLILHCGKIKITQLEIIYLKYGLELLRVTNCQNNGQAF